MCGLHEDTGYGEPGLGLGLRAQLLVCIGVVLVGSLDIVVVVECRIYIDVWNATTSGNCAVAVADGIGLRQVHAATVVAKGVSLPIVLRRFGSKVMELP
jgi:hypothetical protein